jgi:hypothetical protein
MVVRLRPSGSEAVVARAKEDAEADALLAPLLKSPIRFRGANVDTDARFQTAAVVRNLCRAAHARHEKQPQFSLLITNAACRIALGLPKSNKERRPVLALAVRERANAFRYLGRFTEPSAGRRPSTRWSAPWMTRWRMRMSQRAGGRGICRFAEGTSPQRRRYHRTGGSGSASPSPVLYLLCPYTVGACDFATVCSLRSARCSRSLRFQA